MQIWDVASAKLVRSIEVPREWQGAFAVCLSPDGRVAAVGGRRTFGIYSVETGMLLAEETHADRRLSERSELLYDLTHVEFSPDGTLLLTGGNDGTVKLWRVVR